MIGCRNQSYIDLVRFAATKPFEFSFLQDPQQFALKFEREVTDFVKKKRATVSQVESSTLAVYCARVGALLVTEKFALNQVRRKCRTIDLDERPCTTGTALVNGTCNQFLSRSGLP